jgi:hypothetical protein
MLKELIFKVILLVFAIVLTANTAFSQTQAYQPSWYDVQGNEEFAYFYGQQVDPNRATAEAEAETWAKVDALHYVIASVSSIVKDYSAESGLEGQDDLDLYANLLGSYIFIRTLPDIRIVKRETKILGDEQYQHFVQLSIPRASINSYLVDVIRKVEKK